MPIVDLRKQAFSYLQDTGSAVLAPWSLLQARVQLVCNDSISECRQFGWPLAFKFVIWRKVACTTTFVAGYWRRCIIGTQYYTTEDIPSDRAEIPPSLPFLPTSLSRSSLSSKARKRVSEFILCCTSIDSVWCLYTVYVCTGYAMHSLIQPCTLCIVFGNVEREVNVYRVVARPVEDVTLLGYLASFIEFCAGIILRTSTSWPGPWLFSSLLLQLSCHK